MSNCLICQDSVPRHQTFCPHCGARRTIDTAKGHTEESFFPRLKGFFRGVFRSEQEKEAEGWINAGFDAAGSAAGWDPFSAALPAHEQAVLLNPSRENKSILATTYLGAGNERLGLTRLGGPLEQLQPEFSFFSGGMRPNTKAKEILSWVSKVRRIKDKEGLQYSKAYKGLNESLNGSLAMYERSLDIDPANPRAYSARASAFQQVADGILMAYGIFPVRFLKHSTNEVEYEPVQYGDAQLGMCIKRRMPNLEFLTEIIWLYEQAEEEYKEALRLDPTDTRSCVKLSHVLRQLGKSNEATDYSDKALAILNKAILADNDDKGSYSERAEIFQELGRIELAISDLERLLTLSTSKFELDQTRQKIEELRKGKEAGGGQHNSV